MPKWGKLSSMLQAGMRLDFNSAFFFVFSNDNVTQRVIELNTDGQLFELGVDSTGKRLDEIGGGYSPTTVGFKQVDGLPFDRVTLFQEGDFYKTFKAKAGKTGVVIEADTMKEGEDLQDRWGTELLGLTDESKTELNDEIIPLVIDYITSTLLR